MFANTYSPRSLVTVFRPMLVRSLVSVTSTPGMTPPESLMAPRKPPWNPCPNAVLEVTTARNAPSRSAARNLMFPLRIVVDGRTARPRDSRGTLPGLQQVSYRKWTTGRLVVHFSVLGTRGGIGDGAMLRP